jgi:hypothetical protein
MRAIRDGSAVDDPRDAALAVAWARRIQARSAPRWALPRTRPRGWRAAAWILHAVWVSAVVATAIVLPTWRRGGAVRWLAVLIAVDEFVLVPWILSWILRARWNAPEAERRNRELLESRSMQ